MGHDKIIKFMFIIFFPSSSFKLCKKKSRYKKLNVIVGICRCVDSNFNWHTTGLGKKNQANLCQFLCAMS